jgi:phage gp37-like protein
MRHLITILGALLVSLPARSVEYYIDYVGGDNNNDGLSEATPWKHHPWDPDITVGTTAANAAATLDLSSTNYFKKGVSYGGRLFMQADGTSAAEPLWITSKTGWGTGHAIFSSTNVLNGAIYFYTSGGSPRVGRNYVFDSVVFQDLGGYADNDPILLQDCTQPVDGDAVRGGVAISMTVGSEDIVVRNVIFDRVGQWRNSTPFSGVNSVTGVGINATGVNGLLVEGCYFAAMKVGVSLKGGNAYEVRDVLITNCYFNSNMVWQVDIGAQTSTAVFSNLVIEASTFNRINSFDRGNWNGCGGNPPHTDSIFLRSSQYISDYQTPVIVRNCNFFGDDRNSSTGGTASIYVSEGPSVVIEGCVMSYPRMSNGTITAGWPHANILTGSTQYITIRHNTLLSGSQDGIRTGRFTQTNRFRVYNIYNNLVVRRTSGNIDACVFMGVGGEEVYQTFNYNAYSKILQGSSTLTHAYNSDTDSSPDANYSLAQHQANGYEPNSIYVMDPMLECGVGPFGQSVSTLSYRPLAGSPLIGAGMWVADLPPDQDGNPRANPPTIGAYEYTVISDPPGTPTGLTATPVATNQINLTWSDVTQETGYELDRKTGSGGTWAQIATPAANATSYQDTGLTQETTYYYRIRATNSVGDSGNSDEANATTLAPSDPPPPTGETTTQPGRGLGRRR